MFDAIVHGMGRLLAYFYGVIPNYGVAIILLTVAVRLAMIPLAVKQAHIMEANRGNQEKMRKLAPEVKKIKEKYKDDRTKQYEEQKKLYDQHGINMLGGLSGCLPLLLQTPIFMAMYQVLSGCNKLFGSGRKCVPGFHVPSASDLHAAIVSGKATFLGMNLNLRPTAVYQAQGLPEALPYYILIALMGLTMWYQMKQMSKTQTVDPAMAQTQKLMQLLPLMLVVFSVNFPVGLTVYWTATNIWTIGQQYVLLKHVAKVAGRPVATTTKERSGLLGRVMGAIPGAGKGAPSPTKPKVQRPKPASSQKGEPQRGRQGGRQARGASGRASRTGRPVGGSRPDRLKRDGSRQTTQKMAAAAGGNPGANGGPSAKEGSPNGQPGADTAAAEGTRSGDGAEPKAGGGTRPPASTGKGASAPRGSASSRPARKGGQQRGSGKSRSSARRKSRGGRK